MVKTAKNIHSETKSILSQHRAGRSSLIAVLQDIQERCGFLSQETIEQLEKQTGISANEIYGVASFYTQFRFSPPGEHTAQVCLGTACHVRGGQRILREIEQQLGITAGGITEDGKFDLQRVACLGCCALAPVVTIDGKVHARMNVKKIPALLAQYGGGRKDDKDQ